MAVARRALDLVLPLEHFSARRSVLHSATANVENSFDGRTSAPVADSLGRIHIALFFGDVWVANGVLQLWSMASDGDAAGNCTSEGRAAWEAVDGAHASGASDYWGRRSYRADCHAVDFRTGTR